MTMNPPLSILIIGCHKQLMDKMMDWNKKGLISLAGRIDPLSEQINNLVEYMEQLADRHIDIIFIAGEEKAYLEEAQMLRQKNRLIIDADTLWFLDNIMQQLEEIQRLTKKQKIFQTILTHSHEGVQFIDSEGIVQFVNPALRKFRRMDL